MHYSKTFLLLILMLLSVNYSNAQEKKETKNWIAIYIWDSFTPLVLDQTIPEMLVSLEIIFQQHATYTTKKISNTPIGKRSTEGHFMLWLHLDEGLLERNGLKRSDFDDKIFMYKDRDSDIFTAWCGQANFRDFILDGVSGLTNKTIYNDGTISGTLDDFANAVQMGNAEYGAGFYLSDEQMIKALKAIKEYGGFEKGYSFISKVKDRPEQEGYELQNAQGVNGYNCNDFAFYMLEKAEVMTKQETEDLKVEFWYPEYYWNHTIPLTGSGARIFKAFDKNRSLYMDRGQILKLAWSELLFSGLDIFDEKSLCDSIKSKKMKFNKVRLWDQVTMIEYLKNPSNRDFKAKLVVEELLEAVENNHPITTPYQEKEQRYNYRVTKTYDKYTQGCQKRKKRKFKKMKMTVEKLEEYQKIEQELK